MLPAQTLPALRTLCVRQGCHAQGLLRRGRRAPQAPLASGNATEAAGGPTDASGLNWGVGKEKQKPRKAPGPPASTSSADDIRILRLQKVAEMRRAGSNPFAYRFDRTAMAAELQAAHVTLEAGQEIEGNEAVAGRIMARRVFGKLAFLSMQARQR